VKPGNDNRFVRDARKVTVANRTTVKTSGISGLFRKIREIPETEVIYADQIIRKLDRLISDEERHMRLVSDALGTIKATMTIYPENALPPTAIPLFKSKLQLFLPLEQVVDNQASYEVGL
jgi:hypothetical protein